MKRWMILAALLLTPMALAQTVQVGEPLSSLELEAYSLDYAWSLRAANGSDPLSFGVSITNRSDQRAERLIVGSFVFDAQGPARGFITEEVEAPLAPGETVGYQFFTDTFRLRRDDVVVVAAERVDRALESDWWRGVLPTAARLPALDQPPDPPATCLEICTMMAQICEQICGETGVESFQCIQGTGGNCRTSCRCTGGAPTY